MARKVSGCSDLTNDNLASAVQCITPSSGAQAAQHCRVGLLGRRTQGVRAGRWWPDNGGECIIVSHTLTACCCCSSVRGSWTRRD